MLLSQIRKKYRESLSLIYPSEEINSIFEIAVENFLGMDRLDMHRSLDKNTSPGAEKKMMAALTRLTQNEPIQYITGICQFFDLPLKIRPGILIPRQETEYLVHIILKDLSSLQPHNLIDLCTGSGCIALALAKNLPLTRVCATDISDEALELSRENARMNEVNIDFVKEDLVNPSQIAGKFDLLVSNPPYVRNSEKSQMHPNVLEFEPPLALFVEDEDPLIYYRAIIRFATHHLHPEGKMYLEINEYLGKEMLELFQENGFRNIEILHDLNNKERYLRCTI